MRDQKREAAWQKRMVAIGEFIESLGRGRGTVGIEGGELVKLTIKCPREDEPQVLLVVKACGEEGDVVAFVGALDIGTAFLTWRAKDGAKGLKWKPDKPWSPR